MNKESDNGYIQIQDNDFGQCQKLVHIQQKVLEIVSLTLHFQ